MHRLPALVGFLFLSLSVFLPTTAMADSPLAPDTTRAESAEAAGEAGLWTQTVAAVRRAQQSFHRELTQTFQGLVTGEDRAAAGWSLVILSFLYGVFHAAGPGHGKTVITAYLLANERAIKRGMILSASAALVQGLTAVLLVFGLASILDFGMRQSMDAARWLEGASYALVLLLGGYLLIRAVRQLLRLRKDALYHYHDHTHGDDHDHHGACCGHSHAPDADSLNRPLSLKTGLSLVLSIGLRPCSGAILVLLFAVTLGLEWFGAISVLAMSVGTAISVSALALAALGSKHIALRLVSLDSRTTALVGSGLQAVAGGVILLLGASLLLSLQEAAHPLLQ